MNGYRGYLELVRPANVATALADVLAGYAVAGLGSPGLGWLLLSTACLYGGGVVLNDVFDRRPRSDRAARTADTERARVRSASRRGSAWACSPPGSSRRRVANRGAGMVAGATAACVLLYDAWGKRQGLLGPLNMGMCRGLNLLLGISAAPAMLSEAWPLALLPLVYITAVTAVSRGEVHGGRREVAAFALISLSLVLAALLALALRRGGGSWAGVAFALVLAWRVLPAFWGAYRTPGPGRFAMRSGPASCRSCCSTP